MATINYLDILDELQEILRSGDENILRIVRILPDESMVRLQKILSDLGFPAA